jgi:hypothetical protein
MKHTGLSPMTISEERLYHLATLNGPLLMTRGLFGTGRAP